MSDLQEKTKPGQVARPEEKASADDGSPKFGRLLVVLFFAVMIVVALTFISEAMYS